MPQSIHMLPTDSRRQSRLEHLPDRRNVIIRNPTAEVEDLGSNQRDRIEDTADLMDLDVLRNISPEPDYKPFDSAGSERNDDAATRFYRAVEPVNKRPRKRQADRDVGVHTQLGTEAEQFGANLFHVFPDFALLLGGSQQIRRMECRNNPYSVHIEKFSSQPGNGRRCLQHRLRCKRPQTTHDLGTNGRQLLLKKWIARCHFVRLGVAILRWTAFQNVADVDIFTLEVDRFDDLRQ